MTGVEVILAALMAGAAAGGTDAAKAAVTDTYTGLRDALRRRFAGRHGAEQALEAAETEPGVWRARLAEDLTGSGADRDERILALARQLLEQTGKFTVDVRDAKGVQVGDHNVQHNTFS